MPPTLHSTTLPTWIEPLDVLERAASNTRVDLAMLHSGPAQGFSVLAFDPVEIVQSSEIANPLPLLQSKIAGRDFTSPHPLVGWLGFLSYDVGSTLESIPRHVAVAPGE